MQIRLNGKTRELAPAATVGSLLIELNLGQAAVAVELNGEICPQEQFGRTLLNEGDRIEVVQFVGGG